VDQSIIRAFKADYRPTLLKSVVSSELQVSDFLKTVTHNIALALKPTSSMTIENCWPKYIATTGDGIEHEEEYLGFAEEDAHAASSTLYDRLQTNHLGAWVRENDETPDEEIVAEEQISFTGS
jgi:hypothetical protein